MLSPLTGLLHGGIISALCAARLYASGGEQPNPGKIEYHRKGHLLVFSELEPKALLLGGLQIQLATGSLS